MQKAKQAEYKPFDASLWKLGLVVAQFNKPITEQLQNSALDRAKEYKIPNSNITVLEVAGAIEIPLVLQRMAKSGDYDALLAIGCVIQGATPHFDYVCKFVTDGVLRVQLDYSMPIGFGILTCNDEAEAQARAQLGSEHLDAVLHQVKELRQYLNP